jgi:hypothetical protein
MFVQAATREPVVVRVAAGRSAEMLLDNEAAGQNCPLSGDIRIRYATVGHIMKANHRR